MKALAPFAFVALALIAVVPCCLTHPAVAAEAHPAAAIAALHVEGMTCGSCATAVKLVLQKIPGVSTARVSYEQKQAIVTYDPAKTSPAKIAAGVRGQLPYVVTPLVTPAPPRKQSVQSQAMPARRPQP